MQVVKEIGDYKRDNNLTVFQAGRWIDIFQNRPEQAAKLGLDKLSWSRFSNLSTMSLSVFKLQL